MCNTNDALKFGRGNGTLWHCIKVRMKQNAWVQWKNWDGRKVNTTSVDQIEWIQFEHWPQPPPSTPPSFKLKPKSFSSVVQFLPSQDCDIRLSVNKISITQFTINGTIATTGHKLQGMSKDVLIVNSWDYCMTNWVYVVLSRVCTLSGLYLCKPLALDK